MTVPTTTLSVAYTGNGVTTAFAYPFRIIAASHLVVRTTDTLLNAATLTLGVDYTVSGVGDASGGTVTLIAALAADWTLDISRFVPYLQETDLSNHGAFLPQIHEDAFDTLCMQIQQLWSLVLGTMAAVQAGGATIREYTTATMPDADAWPGLFIIVRDTGGVASLQLSLQTEVNGTYAWTVVAAAPPAP